MTAQGRCERCDRVDCKRSAPLSPEMHAVMSRILAAAGNATVEDRRSVYDHQMAQRDIEDDCEAHAVDWRQRALGMGASWIAILSLAGVTEDDRPEMGVEHVLAYMTRAAEAFKDARAAHAWRATVEPLIDQARSDYEHWMSMAGARDPDSGRSAFFNSLDALLAATATKEGKSDA